MTLVFLIVWAILGAPAIDGGWTLALVICALLDFGGNASR